MSLMLDLMNNNLGYLAKKEAIIISENEPLLPPSASKALVDNLKSSKKAMDSLLYRAKDRGVNLVSIDAMDELFKSDDIAMSVLFINNTQDKYSLADLGEQKLKFNDNIDFSSVPDKEKKAIVEANETRNSINKVFCYSGLVAGGLTSTKERNSYSLDKTELLTFIDLEEFWCDLVLRAKKSLLLGNV